MNISLVLGEQAALLVDTRASHREGRELLAELTRLRLPVPLEYVVNTHAHFDHCWGNDAFPTARKLAHDNAIRSWPDQAAQLRDEFAEYAERAAEYGCTPAELADSLATTVDPPDEPVASHHVLDLGDRLVVLRHTGRGHTDGDLTVLVPDADVLIAGDLVEESAPPALGPDSWPLDWPGTLAGHLEPLATTGLVVPGHGAPVPVAYAKRQRRELADFATVAADRYAAGWDLDRATRTADPALPYPLDHLRTGFARVWMALAGGVGARAPQ